MSAYNDVEQSLAARARSYLDLNCAHCHNPAGSGYYLGMDLRYTTAFAETGIDSRGAQITERMSTAGELHMPRIGTSVDHTEGVALVAAYIESLKVE